MLSLSQAVTLRGATGDVLPTVFPRLAEAGIHFRRGQMSMLFAGSGTGKSLLALKLALSVEVPTLYVSADTDKTTTAARAATMITGHVYADVEKAIKEDSPQGAYYLSEIDNLEHMRFTFESSPEVDDIVAEVEAYGMVYGEYPHLIVVDNLRNVYEDSAANDSARYRVLLDQLHQLAEQTQAHVMVLHHAVGEYDDGQKVPPKSGIDGKVSQIPSLILSLARPGGTDLAVAPVKNRNGEGDATGKWRIWFRVDMDRMQFSDPPEPEPPRVRYSDDDWVATAGREGW